MKCLESQCGKSYTVSAKVYMQKLEDDMAKKKAAVQ
jgi:hypothetical protein